MNFDPIYNFLADYGYTHPLHPTLSAPDKIAEVQDQAIRKAREIAKVF